MILNDSDDFSQDHKNETGEKGTDNFPLSHHIGRNKRNCSLVLIRHGVVFAPMAFVSRLAQPDTESATLVLGHASDVVLRTLLFCFRLWEIFLVLLCNFVTGIHIQYTILFSQINYTINAYLYTNIYIRK